MTWGPPRPTCLHGPAGKGQLSAPRAGPRTGQPPWPHESSWAGPGPRLASGPRKVSLSPRAAAPNDDTIGGLKQLHLFSPASGGQESRDQRAGCLRRLQGAIPWPSSPSCPFQPAELPGPCCLSPNPVLAPPAPGSIASRRTSPVAPPADWCSLRAGLQGSAPSSQCWLRVLPPRCLRPSLGKAFLSSQASAVPATQIN